MVARADSTSHANSDAISIGDGSLGLEQLNAVVFARAKVDLSESRAFEQRLARSRAALDKAMELGQPVYGVTTGYGKSCGNRVDQEQSLRLGENLIRYHGCGVGQPLAEIEARAATLCRLVGLSLGYSGVSRGLLQALVDLLNHGIAPIIPSQGSVGASGDLTPLSYLAACLAGEREVFHRGLRKASAEALAAEGLVPYRFGPKEPLAMINGTSVMTGIAIVAMTRAQRLLEAATRATGLTVHGLLGHAHHFDAAIFEAKPHPGQARVAQRLRGLLQGPSPALECEHPDWLQDPYSVRCAPHVLGVLADSLDWIERWVVVEANSGNDNPLLDPDSQRVLMGGNFFGGHVAFAMDGLKVALASVADLLDRQMALLVDERFNRGLPANLVTAADPALHHGFKGLQITASALTAEALKETMPAAAFSRSTESHNQDKVSLGTIAARDAQKVARLVAGVVGVHLLAASQAAEIRGRLETRPALATSVQAVRRVSERLEADRPMDQDVERMTEAILEGSLFGRDDGALGA